MHDADGVPSRRCVKNSTLLRSRVEFPRKTILFFSLSTWQGALHYSVRRAFNQSTVFSLVKQFHRNMFQIRIRLPTVHL